MRRLDGHCSEISLVRDRWAAIGRSCHRWRLIDRCLTMPVTVAALSRMKTTGASGGLGAVSWIECAQEHDLRFWLADSIENLHRDQLPCNSVLGLPHQSSTAD
jgi:hypothetical protein